MMPDQRARIRLRKSAPSYVGWRGQLLAELALTRLPELNAYKPPSRSHDLSYDFLVTTPDGFCFFVIVRAFSSFDHRLRQPEKAKELRWPLEADLVRRARKSRSPVVLFLFDADREHGRFLRLDTLPPSDNGASTCMVRLPVENTITRESVERLVESLQGSPITQPALGR